MTSKIKRPVLERFVEDHPEKALEVLIKCCHDPDIEKDIVDYILEQSLKTTNNTDNNDAYVAPAPRKSSASQRTPSFSSDPRHSTRNYPGTGLHADPPTPAKTGSNPSVSLSGKDGKEHIVILDMNEDDDIKKHPATIMSAPIKYSVINRHMFDVGRICNSNIEEIEEEQILVPRRGAPGTFMQVTVSSYAELTWKRSKSNASHKTMFYLVDQEFLDIDLLLGSLDSGEDMPETMPPPPPRKQGLNFKEHSESYHRSSNPRHGSKVSTRVQPDEILRSFERTQREQVAVQSQSAFAAARNQRIDPSRTSHHSTADPSSPTHMANPTPGSDKIRVSCTLGSSALNFWLDLDGPAQEFFVTLQKEFDKKKVTLDRPTTSILFTREKTPDDEGREIQLSEDELEADWEETMAWIRDNKRQKSPHIYATIQYHEA